MNRATVALAAVALLGLAGCTGNFEIDQTEPIRIQLEGSESMDVRLADDDPREVRVETEDAEVVDVDVRVTPTEERSVIIVKVQSGDDDARETLEERRIEANGSVVQNFVIDVRGKDNIVVVAQSVEGDAEVNVAASSSDGEAEVDNDLFPDEGDGMTTTAPGTGTDTTTTDGTTDTTTDGTADETTTGSDGLAPDGWPY